MPFILTVPLMLAGVAFAQKVSSGGLASARESLCRGLGSRWFTERFHRNALVTHFQHGQVFCAARRLENYASPAADFINARPRGDTQLMWLRLRSTSSVPTMLTTRSVPAALA
jgi:phytoene/squalene synthetase